MKYKLYLFMGLFTASAGSSSHIYSFSIFNSSFFSRLWPTYNQEIITKEYAIQPECTVEITNQEGGITLKTWSQRKILIEAVKKGSPEQLQHTTVGIKVTDHTITITTRCTGSEQPAHVDYTIMLPEQASATIKTDKGPIKIKHMLGSIDAFSQNGSIEICDAVQTVVAKTHKGSIKVKQKSFSQPYALFLEALQGSIDLFLPIDSNADLQAQTLSGSVTSELPVTLHACTVKLNKDTWDRLKREVHGTLGTGGAPITIEVNRGNIVVHAY